MGWNKFNFKGPSNSNHPMILSEEQILDCSDFPSRKKKFLSFFREHITLENRVGTSLDSCAQFSIYMVP